MGSQFHPMVASAAGVVMLAYIAVQVIPVLEYVKTLSYQSGMSSYFAVAIKALGIALVCQLASEICRDCGEASVGGRIELAGKAAIIIISLPVLKNLVTFARELL
jgi:stage III sporulation protein AD